MWQPGCCYSYQWCCSCCGFLAYLFCFWCIVKFSWFNAKTSHRKRNNLIPKSLFWSLKRIYGRLSMVFMYPYNSFSWGWQRLYFSILGGFMDWWCLCFSCFLFPEATDHLIHFSPILSIMTRDGSLLGSCFLLKPYNWGAEEMASLTQALNFMVSSSHPDCRT